MRTLLAIPVFLLVSMASHADTIVCSFTEPFYTSTFKMNKSTLAYVDPEGTVTLFKKSKFVIKEPGVFRILSKNNVVLQTLKLTFNGSDGMSDKVYPYEVKDESGLMTANNGIGGCESDELKGTIPPVAE